MSRKRSEPLLNMKEVKDYLGISYGLVYALVESGKLRAVQVTGDPIPKEIVSRETLGIRFYPEDVRQFLENQTIR